MATICLTCGTENRPFSKFCIECIATLPTSFAPTDFLPRVDPGANSLLPGARSKGSPTGFAPVSRSTVATAPSTRSASHARNTPNAKKGLWVSVAALVLALLVGAGGWLIAGAGGWYIYSSSVSSGVPRSVAAEDTGPRAHAAASTALLAAAPITPVILNESPMPELPISKPPPPAPVSTPAPTPSAPAAAVIRAVPKARPAPVAELPTAAANPRTQCDGRNFFASASCMAAQCAKPVHRQHPECEAVRRQQRLMDEKRNPTMLN